MTSDISDIRSMLSDILSNVQSGFSDLKSFAAGRSQLSDLASDIKSAVAGVTATVGASDISDIASAVLVILTPSFSDVKSAVSVGSSRVLLVQSRLSDFDSRLVSDISDLKSYLSDIHSDLRSYVAGRSQLSDLASDVKSAVAAVTATVGASDISDIASAVKAALASDLSDILSAATAGASRALLVQSDTSNIYSLLSDVNSDLQSDLSSIQSDLDNIQTRLPAALVSGRMDSNAAVVGDKTGYAIGTGGIDAAAFAAGAIDNAAIATDAIGAAELAATAIAEIADGFLDRNMATGTDSGSTTVRTPRQALRAIRNKVGIAAGTLTVTKEDDSTASWTAAVTTAAGNPISEVDPAGP
jgi:hypothetical protein